MIKKKCELKNVESNYFTFYVFIWVQFLTLSSSWPINWVTQNQNQFEKYLFCQNYTIHWKWTWNISDQWRHTYIKSMTSYIDQKLSRSAGQHWLNYPPPIFQLSSTDSSSTGVYSLAVHSWYYPILRNIFFPLSHCFSWFWFGHPFQIIIKMVSQQAGDDSLFSRQHLYLARQIYL